MRMFFLFPILYRLGMLSPRGLYRLIAAIARYGTNVMTLLKLAEQKYGPEIAIADDRETISYRQLWSESERLSIVFRQQYGLASGRKVGLMCGNHASLVKSIFAASYTGADIYLLNAEMSLEQFNQLVEEFRFDLLVYDEERASIIEQSSYSKEKLLSYHATLPAIDNLIHTSAKASPIRFKSSSSQIMLLTGGTTGKSKKVAHKPSLLGYLPPFETLLAKLNLMRRSTAYIATPIYHGYGIAILLLFTAIGKKIVLTHGFDAAKACGLVRKHNVEVVTVVPLMVHKMIKHNAGDLKTLACIVSGGAELNPKLTAEVSGQLGNVLYNLYGTSEAGLTTVATPQDLKHSANTIGRRIRGVRLHVLDDKNNKAAAGVIGQLCILNQWSLRSLRRTWIATGDMGCRDRQGYYYVCGRVDDMVVSAGENVYPIEVERVLILHPSIEDAAVVGMPDDIFGQRLKAVVQPVQGAALTSEALTEWLRPKLARYQMPKEIVFVDRLPYTHLGKRDKKSLK